MFRKLTSLILAAGITLSTVLVPGVQAAQDPAPDYVLRTSDPAVQGKFLWFFGGGDSLPAIKLDNTNDKKDDNWFLTIDSKGKAHLSAVKQDPVGGMYPDNKMDIDLTKLGDMSKYLTFVEELNSKIANDRSEAKNLTADGDTGNFKVKGSYAPAGAWEVLGTKVLLDSVYKAPNPSTRNSLKDDTLTTKPLNIVDPTVYLRDYMLIQFFNQFVDAQASMSIEDLRTATSEIQHIFDGYNASYSEYLFPALRAKASIKTEAELNDFDKLIAYVQSKSKAKEDAIAKTIGTDTMLKNYVSPVALNGYLQNAQKSNYEKYTALMFGMTTKIDDDQLAKSFEAQAAKFITTSNTGKYIKEDSDHDKLLNKAIYQILNDNGLTLSEKIALVSIGSQRASTYALGTSNELVMPSIATATADDNAKANAEAKYKEISTMLGAQANSNMDDSIKQMYTINLRIQYHYWAMQTSTSTGVDANNLSKTSDGRQFYRYLKPIKVKDSLVVDPLQYTLLMNALNEIPLTKNFDLKELGDLMKGVTSASDLVDRVTYLKQMKNAITFLETYNSDDFPVQEVIDMWYEKSIAVDGSNVSLEDAYNKAQELGIQSKNLTSYTNVDDSKPLAYFFDLSKKKINDYLAMGIKESATYTPLKSNVYDPHTFRNIENDNFFRFHYQWGYYRKALYIDTNVKAAVDRYNTGKIGKKRVATLKDMFEPEKDIVLSIDSNMYNVKSLADMQGKTLDRISQTEKQSAASVKSIWQWATDAFSIDIMETTKTGGETKYSDSLKGITKYASSGGEDFEKKANNKDQAVFGKDLIDHYLKPNDGKNDTEDNLEYSVMQPFAFVSSVYRDTQLFDLLNTNVGKPVFISSKDLYSAGNTTKRDKGSLLNYALLKNLPDNQVVGYSSTLDMNSPIYMDIYGNILTESGYVVVPAMSNATLQTDYSPYNAGFLSTYGNIYKLPTSYKDLGVNFDIFTENKVEEVYDFKDEAVGGNSKVDVNRLRMVSDSSIATLYSLGEYQFEDRFDFTLYVTNIFMEVVRGAPIQNINKDFENLNTNRNISRSGILHAVKLDSLKESLDMNSQNAILAIPNLAFVDGIQYVILFTYKATIIICIVMILIQIFVAAMQQRAGFRTVFGIAGTLAITLAAIFTVPVVFNVTYYQSNKLLLQNETEYIAMLNLEKEQSGVEIGMTSVGAPNIDTTLLMKVQDVNIPWYDLFFKIIYAPINSNMSKIYEDYATNNLAMNQRDFQLKNDTLYMDMKDLFDSSDIAFDSSFQASYASLYQTTKGDLPASFYTPYYVMLDSLIAEVNKYNSENDGFSYTTGTYKGGRLKSLGLIKQFFTSDQFISDNTEDVLHLREVYGMDINDALNGSPFEDKDIEAMQKSQWLDITHEPDQIATRIDKINKEARTFVIENQNLIGKISDETFLKAMALHLSMYHNKLFGVDSFNNIEIYNLSVDDLTRLSIADKETVMKGSPQSYTRFVYDTSGDTGIYLSAVHSIIVYISGWVKPIVTVIMFLVLFISFFVYKIILRKSSDNLSGYFKIFGLLCLCNVLYAGLIKVSMFLPELGLKPAVCLLIQIVLHILFLGVYAFITTISVKNWRDIASENLRFDKQDIQDFFFNGTERRRQKGLKDAEENEDSGWRIYKRMKDADAARKYTIKKGRDAS